MEKIKLVLSQPIKFGSEEVTELHFRAPVARDFRSLKIQSMSMGDLLDLASILSDTEKSKIDMLSAKDALKVVEIVSSFLS